MLASPVATLARVSMEPAFEWCQSDVHVVGASAGLDTFGGHEHKPEEGLIIGDAFLCYRCLKRALAEYGPHPPPRRRR